MTERLDLPRRYRDQIEALLREHVPGVEVWAYGSRVNGRSHEGSDLDLVLRGPDLKRIDSGQLADLIEALEESNVPIIVQTHDWTRLPERFHREIERKYVVLVERGEEGTTKSRGEWLETSLGEVIELKRGYDLPRYKRVPGSVPLVSSSGVSDYHVEAKVKGPGVVTGRYGTLGQVFFVPDDFWPLNTTLYVRQFKGNDPRFISYFLRGLDFLAYSDKAAVPGLNRNHLHQATVRYPSDVSEQRAIAHVLGTLDDKIELNRRMNETLEEMARALFKSWFVDFDPVRAKMEGRDTGLPPDVAALFPDRLVESELGEIPEGWEVKSLDKIADFRNGLALQKFRPTENEKRLPVVKIAQLRSGQTDSKEWATKNITQECIIDDGDVVFSWSGSLMIKIWCGGRAALNQHLFKVTSSEYPKWFYLHCVESHLPEFQSIAADKTTTMGHIKRQHLSEAKCVVPGPTCLAVANGTFAGLLSKRISNVLESNSLASLRDALLPKLISGEMRVNLWDEESEVIGKHP